VSSAVDPEVAYGPDDPGYGPPGPDWYRRAEAAPAGPAAEQGAQPSASPPERGPFEPARHEEERGHGEGAEHGQFAEPADAAQPAEDGDGPPAVVEAAGAPETPEFDPAALEAPDLVDLGPEDPADGPLGGLKNLYETAETIGSDRLERNLHLLLERQRKLITAYFTASGDLGPADQEPSPVSLGFDSAESLAGLRGELRVSS
jgi:hypothetical protein